MNPSLPLGYSHVPKGMLATVVTSLEMRAKPVPGPAPSLETRLVLERRIDWNVEAYRTLFRAVGRDWLWCSRLVMADDKLKAILTDPRVEVYILTDMGRDLGLLELDFREEGQCELAFFGLVPEAIGQGVGRLLMDEALRRAWARPIGRLWVHTCTLDHPAAVDFYRRSGFVPYECMVELMPDPRLTGHLPREAAPRIPLIAPA